MFQVTKNDKNAEINQRVRIEDKLCFIDIDYKTQTSKTPDSFALCWDFFEQDCYSIFSPSIRDFRGKGMNWNPQKTESRLASWFPIHCIISRNDRNRLNITVSDAQTPIRISTGINERNGVYACRVEFFTKPTTPIMEYHATIRLDYRDIPYYESIYGSVDYWETKCGYVPATVPEYAKKPMDSIWYSFHQNLDEEEILKECASSKAIGMKTVIIDDGWQTADNSGGYAYCGDWKLCEKKISDMRSLVDNVHKMGMKVMLWYSIPFIGFYSQNFDKYKGMLLKYSNETRFGVFDPRYIEVRKFLIETYVNAVVEWDLDGLKLDFIDSFELTEESAKFDEKRDFESLEDAIDCLLKEIISKLYSVKPDILIEFRQSYVGPSIRKYANMLRVTDCPADSLRNRSDVINLRLTSGKTMVHSDMLMWSTNDSKEEVACQLINVLYAVPQISVKISELSEQHLKVLKNYLEFWHKYSDVILDGYFTADSPEVYYSQARSVKEDTAIVSVYSNPFVCCKNRTNIIVNASKINKIYLEDVKDSKYNVCDCLGELIESGSITESSSYIVNVPFGSTVYVCKDIERF